MEQLWDDLNAPSAKAFRSAIARQGIPVRAGDISKFVESKSERAIYAPGPKYKGKNVAFDVDHRWQADLISFASNPAKVSQEPKRTFKRLKPIREDDPRPYTMVLLVIDIFSRYLWATPLKSTSDTATAFQQILKETGRKPQQLDTDGGTEFTANVFRQLCDSENIEHTVKDKNDRNATANVDAAIGVLKRAIKRRQASSENSTTWLQQLQPAVNGYNKTEHSATNAPPDNLTDDNIMSQQILNTENLKTNMDQIDKRQASLKDKGFRVQVIDPKKKGLKRRGDDAIWSSTIHIIQSFPAPGIVRDTDGKDFKTKLVKSAPLDSTAVQAQPRKGTAMSTLRPYAVTLQELLGSDGKASGPAMRELKTRKSNFSSAINATNLSFARFVDKFPDLIVRRNGKLFANT